jgi:hypothetical protein
MRQDHRASWRVCSLAREQRLRGGAFSREPDRRWRVDIQASKGTDNLLVQCKYWHAQNVGPNVIREMLGTLQTFPQGAKGVIVTSSELTPAAKELAIEHGIQFIERVNFAQGIQREL